MLRAKIDRFAAEYCSSSFGRNAQLVGNSRVGMRLQTIYGDFRRKVEHFSIRKE
jgi:hypothetical protein